MNDIDSFAQEITHRERSVPSSEMSCGKRCVAKRAIAAARGDAALVPHSCGCCSRELRPALTTCSPASSPMPRCRRSGSSVVGEAFAEDPAILAAPPPTSSDTTRDPAAEDYVTAVSLLKASSLQCIASTTIVGRRRRAMAGLRPERVSEFFAVDIHPAVPSGAVSSSTSTTASSSARPR